MKPSTAYSFRSGISYPVSAKVVGSTLTAIYKKHGSLTPQQVVEEAKDKKHPLHPCFEWNNTKAAMDWRLHQARNLIASVQIKFQRRNRILPVRAFVNIQRTRAGELSTNLRNKGGSSGYVTINEVMSDVSLRNYSLQMALMELERWHEKYKNLREVAKLWSGIKNTVSNIKHESTRKKYLQGDKVKKNR